VKAYQVTIKTIVVGGRGVRHTLLQPPRTFAKLSQYRATKRFEDLTDKEVRQASKAVLDSRVLAQLRQ
jgi:hypothetical protein